MPDFEDLFIEDTDDTSLASHIPDIGTGWASVYTEGTTDLQVQAANDYCLNTVNGVNQGRAYKMQPSPTLAGYDIVWSWQGADESANSGRGAGVFARYTDNDNCYAVQSLPNGDTPANKKIFKRVGGVTTELDSDDTAWVDGDIVKFELRSGSQKLYQNDILRCSATDTDLTVAGEIGICVGTFPAMGDSTVARSVWHWDDFSVTVVVTGSIIPQIMHHRRTLGVS